MAENDPMAIDPFMRAMFGPNAVHVPINLIVQDGGEGGIVTGVFQSCHGLALKYGSRKTHQLIFGDMIIRPHLVCHTDALQGVGISGLARSGFIDVEKWMEGGVLINPMGKRVEEFKKS